MTHVALFTNILESVKVFKIIIKALMKIVKRFETLRYINVIYYYY